VLPRDEDEDVVFPFVLIHGEGVRGLPGPCWAGADGRLTGLLCWAARPGKGPGGFSPYSSFSVLFSVFNSGFYNSNLNLLILQVFDN
jgi:hypothetical protein